MTNRYKKIREALAMRPTPGPWIERIDAATTGDAVKAGKWGRSRLAENDHQNAHRCIDGGEVRECPRMTCEEYLATVVP